MLGNSRRTPFIFIIILLTIVLPIPSEEIASAQGGTKDLIITTLYDNYSVDNNLMAGWGFSCLIRGTEKTILFDAGSCLVLGNMERLKIAPKSVDVLVISHDHPDHTDGMSCFLKKSGAKRVDMRNPVKICEDVCSTGAMEAWIKGLFLESTKEAALVIRTTKGLVVITGCAHPGIADMVRKAKRIFPNEDVYLVMGGFHLDMGGQNIPETVRQFREEKVKKVSPSHCTGDGAISLLKEEYGDDFISGGVGREIRIGDAFLKR